MEFDVVTYSAVAKLQLDAMVASSAYSVVRVPIIATMHLATLCLPVPGHRTSALPDDT